MTVRKLILCCVCLLALLLAAACGNDDAPTPTPTVAPTPAATAAGAATAPPAGPTTDAPAVVTLAQPSPVAQSPAPSPVVSPSIAPTVTAPAAGQAITPTAAITAPAPAAAVVCAVEPNPDLVGYADMQARMGCPLAEAVNNPVAINEFGPGPDYDRFMLWFGSEQQIYVLLPDKSWLAYSDTWSDDQPEIACNPDNLDPATSPPLPRRGFGKLWCTVESVRVAMGSIDREERLCQHAVAQRFEQGRLLACFEDATIRYFRILDDGTWDMEMIQ